MDCYSASFFVFDFLAKGIYIYIHIYICKKYIHIIHKYNIILFLLLGRLDKISGQYYLNANNRDSSNILNNNQNEEGSEQSMHIEDIEERCFMYAPYLFH